MIMSMPASPDLTRRVLIPVAGPTSSPGQAPRVRHYRLARVPTQTRSDPAMDRFAHLRRSYD
ncbi:MAG: hypothetical protein QOE11_3731 [Solirubrobacteraceae bacterium]|nr:hypothetical protein [Solirubrobacteraceae bacterium]